jgi:hypothetical protein
VDPVFDRDGRAVGWRRKDVVFSLDGAAIGFVFNRCLYSLQGAFAGRFEDGIYRDPAGRIVAFERGATGGPILPVPQAVPVAPPHELRPRVPAIEAPPPAPMRSMQWSALDFGELIAGAVGQPRSTKR